MLKNVRKIRKKRENVLSHAWQDIFLEKRTLFKISGALLEQDFDFIREKYDREIKTDTAAIISLITGSDLLRESSEQEETMNMCSALKEWEMKCEARGAEYGKREGIKEGIKEGEWNKLLSMVEKKLQKGKSAEQIAEDLEEALPEIQRAITEMEQAKQ